MSKLFSSCFISFVIIILISTGKLNGQGPLYIPGSVGSSTNTSVGIGTNTPQEKLHVVGNLFLQATEIENTWQRTNLYYTGHHLVIGTKEGVYGHNNIMFRPGGASQGLLNSTVQIYSAKGIGQYTLGVQLSGGGNSFFNSGNVGIGTATPYSKLDIKGTVGLFGTGLDGSTYQRAVIYSDATNGLYFDAPMKSDNTGAPINFAWRGGTPKITFLPSGNVLIGKTTQTNSAYKLDVAGKIRANEIIVNTTGADFVFEPSYKLRSLSEVETFIKENKHLPEIAPAKEMLENGVSAGEMQTKLLQKIEELTLYIIEQSKLIESQNQRIQNLENLNK